MNKTLTPVKGLVVIDPATSRALPPEGARVQGHAEYWQRRINDGDVVAVDDDVSAVDKPVKVNKP